MATLVLAPTCLPWVQTSCSSGAARSRCRSIGIASRNFRVNRSSVKHLDGVRSCSRLRLAATPNDEQQETSSSTSTEPAGGVKSTSGLVEKIEEELGRRFGGALWFTVLIVSLTVFGGFYVYYIVNYASFDDVPILRGTVR